MAHGGKRPGAGRPKGSRNKATELARDAIESEKPIERLFELAAECREEGDRELEFKILAKVLPYAYPKLAASSVDIQGLRGDVLLEVVSAGDGES